MCHSRFHAHYIANILTKVTERGRICEGKRGPDDLLAIRSLLTNAGSMLWAGCLVPPDLQLPNWEEDPLWQAELQQIQREREALAAIVP